MLNNSYIYDTKLMYSKDYTNEKQSPLENKSKHLKRKKFIHENFQHGDLNH